MTPNPSPEGDLTWGEVGHTARVVLLRLPVAIVLLVHHLSAAVPVLLIFAALTNLLMLAALPLVAVQAARRDRALLRQWIARMSAMAGGTCMMTIYGLGVVLAWMVSPANRLDYRRSAEVWAQSRSTARVAALAVAWLATAGLVALAIAIAMS